MGMLRLVKSTKAGGSEFKIARPFVDSRSHAVWRRIARDQWDVDRAARSGDIRVEKALSCGWVLFHNRNDKGASA